MPLASGREITLDYRSKNRGQFSMHPIFVPKIQESVTTCNGYPSYQSRILTTTCQEVDEFQDLVQRR